MNLNAREEVLNHDSNSVEKVVVNGDGSSKSPVMEMRINPSLQKFPYCIVWTPIPCLTWLIPFIGHMGICTSSGTIRDFAGPYHVGEGIMGFGRPTRYLQLSSSDAQDGSSGWDRAVSEASEIYSHRVHNLFCDNCHSHVALALEKMQYNGVCHWNMFKLASWMFFRGRYVGFSGFLKTWLPFLLLFSLFTVCILTSNHLVS